MPAGLSFKQQNKTDDATSLIDFKFIVYEDAAGNKYTLNTENALRLDYTDNAGSGNYTIDNLGGIIGKLIAHDTFKTAVLNDGTDPITDVDALATNLAANTNFAKKVYVKAQEADQVYTKAAAETTFAKKTDLTGKVDVTGDNATEAGVEGMLAKITTAAKKVVQVSDLGTKPTAEAVLGAQDGKKSILVTELGKALDRTGDNADDKVYGTQGQEKIAQAFLGEKGLVGPTGPVGPAGANGSNAPITECSTSTKFEESVHNIMLSDYISDDPSNWVF